MDNIKLWILSVCIFSVIICVYKVLLPNGNIKKTGITVLSLLLIFVMIKPLFSLKSEAYDFDLLSDNDIFYEAQTLNDKNIYKEAIIKTIRDSTEKLNISLNEITVEMNIRDDGNIEINNICLSLESDLQDEEIKQKIQDDTGFSKEIIIINR